MVECFGAGLGTGLKGVCVVCNLFQAQISKGCLWRDTARPQHCPSTLRPFARFCAGVCCEYQEMKQAAVMWGGADGCELGQQLKREGPT